MENKNITEMSFDEIFPEAPGSASSLSSFGDNEDNSSSFSSNNGKNSAADDFDLRYPSSVSGSIYPDSNVDVLPVAGGAVKNDIPDQIPVYRKPQPISQPRPQSQPYPNQPQPRPVPQPERQTFRNDGRDEDGFSADAYQSNMQNGADRSSGFLNLKEYADKFNEDARRSEIYRKEKMSEDEKNAAVRRIQASGSSDDAQVLILGLLSFFFSAVMVLGLILGIITIKKATKLRNERRGKNKLNSSTATVGLVLGWISVFVNLLFSIPIVFGAIYAINNI